MSDAELDALIAEAIATTGATSIKDMGKVMGVVKAKAAGRADMGAVGARIKQKLSLARCRPRMPVAGRGFATAALPDPDRAHLHRDSRSGWSASGGCFASSARTTARVSFDSLSDDERDTRASRSAQGRRPADGSQARVHALRRR